MYDKNKITLNHIRSKKAKNLKVKLFFIKLFEDAIDRLDINRSKPASLLEINAKNDLLENVLKKRKIESEILHTTFIDELKKKRKNFFLENLKLSKVENEKVNYCIGIFPIVTPTDINIKLKSIHRVLSNEGKFLLMFHASQSCTQLKEMFKDILKLKIEKSFLPCFDIISLGNVANSVGFKNVVVDISKFVITIKKSTEIFRFIRDLGESNYLESRNKKSICRLEFQNFNYAINSLIDKKKYATDFSIIFLTGTKKV